MALLSNDDLQIVEPLLPKFKEVAAKGTALSDDGHLRRFLLGGYDMDPEHPLEKATALHAESLLWRSQFAVDRIKVDTVHDELHTGKIIFPGVKDRLGRPTIVLRPRFVVKSVVDPLEFMKSVVYMVEKAIAQMGDVEQMFLIVDFTDANMTNVDTRLPRVALTTIQQNYPRRIGQIYVLNAPWFFKYVWAVISRWMSPDIRGRVASGDAKGLKKYFDEDNIIEEMGGSKKFDYRDWIREQFHLEGMDISKMIKKTDDKKDQKDEEVDNLVVQALEDEMVDHPIKTGYMTKLGGIVKNWKRRYFVLTNGLVRYYKEETDVKPQGSIILERSRVADATAADTDKPHALLVITPLRTYVLVCENAQDKDAWMKVLGEQCAWATNRQ